MRFYLIILFCMISLFACKDKTTVQPTTTTHAITADKVTGTYIGTTHHKYRTDAGSAGIHSDSSSKADTIIITKVSTDSFIVSQPVWDIAQPGFKYDGTATYTRTRGTTSFNDHLDEINITFDTATHSIIIQKHHVSVSSWIMEDWDDFSGKQ